jgi:hypothetical protein
MVADHFAHVRYGVFFNGLLAGKNHCFPSAYYNLIGRQSEWQSVSRLGNNTLGLVAVPYIQFEGACSH